jgi:organic radical activating enzyme
MNLKDTKLNVSELFVSKHGEGHRAGTENIFVRLQDCKAKDANDASGIRCDTEFVSGRTMTLEELNLWMLDNALLCENIIWTGGEPAQQLTAEIVGYFKNFGFLQAIETSGLFPVPKNLDWISVSPKVAEHVIAKNF